MVSLGLATYCGNFAICYLLFAIADELQASSPVDGVSDRSYCRNLPHP